MNKIKKGLGRGLSSLIGETKIEDSKNELPIGKLIPNRFQPRKVFDQKNLEESLDEYQKLIRLNNLIEKKFQKSSKEISESAKFKINEILIKNAKKIK